jgi:hypothetical protein
VGTSSELGRKRADRREPNNSLQQQLKTFARAARQSSLGSAALRVGQGGGALPLHQVQPLRLPTGSDCCLPQVWMRC